MNTLQASQKNRRELIAGAKRIEWNGAVDQYSTDLWLHVLTARLGATVKGGEFVLSEAIYFGGQRLMLTLTELEDLLEKIRLSYHAQREVS